MSSASRTPSKGPLSRRHHCSRSSTIRTRSSASAANTAIRTAAGQLERMPLGCSPAAWPTSAATRRIARHAGSPLGWTRLSANTWPARRAMPAARISLEATALRPARSVRSASRAVRSVAAYRSRQARWPASADPSSPGARSWEASSNTRLRVTARKGAAAETGTGVLFGAAVRPRRPCTSPSRTLTQSTSRPCAPSKSPASSDS